eukprot:11287504-Ditylum_brightwellii.AAC.1
MREPLKSGSSSGTGCMQCSRVRMQPSYAVAKTLLEGDVLTVFKQAEIDHSNQTLPHFNLCLDDMAAQVFPEKAGQTKKRYMWRNIRLGRGITVKEWVA